MNELGKKTPNSFFTFTKRIDKEQMFCYNRNNEFTSYRIGKGLNYGRIKDFGFLKRRINNRNRRN